MFAGAKLRLLAWDAEYGTELPLEGGVVEGDEAVDPAIEMPADAWVAITPTAPPVRPRTVFIDGVRRIDVRVMGSRTDRVFHGLFGSYAVGSTILERSGASFGPSEMRRLLVLGSGESPSASVAAGPALTFEPASTPEHTPAAPLQTLQNAMRANEAELARSLAREPRTLVVVDGPLTFERRVGDRVVGYIKSIHQLRLPSDRLPFLGALTRGARTPIFSVTASGKFTRLSWYLRLAEAPPGGADLFGLARLEVDASIGLEAARELANETSAMLPGLAPSRGRDPRSPQNLLPIGALEAHLRHQLGDRRVVRSQIERAVVREALNESET